MQYSSNPSLRAWDIKQSLFSSVAGPVGCLPNDYSFLLFIFASSTPTSLRYGYLGPFYFQQVNFYWSKPVMV